MQPFLALFYQQLQFKKKKKMIAPRHCFPKVPKAVSTENTHCETVQTAKPKAELLLNPPDIWQSSLANLHAS